MIEGVAVGVVSWLITALGVWVWWSTWHHQLSPYETGGIFSAAFGRNARFGYDAGLPLFVTFLGASLCIASPLLAAETVGSYDSLPPLLVAIAGRTFQVLLATGTFFGTSLLLFLWPKIMAPPHLRGRRGWIPEWVHEVRTHRDQRRAARGQAVRLAARRRHR
jgi:hypothetical protein